MVRNITNINKPQKQSLNTSTDKLSQCQKRTVLPEAFKQGGNEQILEVPHPYLTTQQHKNYAKDVFLFLLSSERKIQTARVKRCCFLGAIIWTVIITISHGRFCQPSVACDKLPKQNHLVSHACANNVRKHLQR